MHQRYFPLYDGEGRLTNKFIVVTNGDPAHAATITGGNERVVRARLSDAKFFYEEDLKHPLETYVDRLDEVVFQEVLGTMKDKTDRIAALARHLAADAQLGAADAADAERAAYLAKADLVTNAVVAVSYTHLDVYKRQGLVGTVAGIQELPGQDLLEVVPAAGGRTVLVPLVDAFVSGIDEDARRIDVDLPDGLLDL